jgi:putative nucleotidyltransferase with HDIG domain
LIGRQPKDWDLATSATPAQIKGVFPSHTATGERYGTITVHLPGGSATPLSVEVTTLRAEEGYDDRRHPSTVNFSDDLLTDLSRRDFTINAMAWSPQGGLIDPFRGQDHLVQRRLATVGDPVLRFREDGLRMLRAARLASQLDFRVDHQAKVGMRALARTVSTLSAERVQAELAGLLVGLNPKYGLRLLGATGILSTLLPEVSGGFGLYQSHYHAWSVYTHTLIAVSLAPPTLEVRLAALLHDIGKTETRLVDEAGRVSFPGHDEVGARLAHDVLTRLRFPGQVTRQVTQLVRYHMFHWEPKEGLEPLRRLAAKVGPEHLKDLAALRRSDLLAVRPLEPGDHRRVFLDALDQAVGETLAPGGVFTPADLVLSGTDLMRELRLSPGPVVGRLLHHLFDAVLADPSRNDRETLLSLAECYLSERSTPPRPQQQRP